MNILSHMRSIAKAISWRVVGSLDTFALGFVLTGKFSTAASIASAEVFTKTFLFYVHERAWLWAGKEVTLATKLAK